MSIESPSKPSVLVGTEDIDFYLLLDHVLQSEGFGSILASDLDEMFQWARDRRPSVILLDCRAQSFPNANTCSRLKQHPRTKSIPVIALISRGAERDQVRLLKAGVDASFSRPIVPAELVEHLRAMLGTGRTVTREELVAYADIEMNTAMYRVQRNGRNIHLSLTEFRLLHHLLMHPEQVITRDELKNAAWQDNVHVGPRTVDVHVGRLRKALNAVSKTDLIRTVRSVGYALSDKALDDSSSEKS